MQKFVRAVACAFRMFGTDRKLFVPFLITAIAEIVLLLLLWLAPQPPFSALLAPPLRYFYSEQILHYPAHLFFLYHAMRHTHLIAATLVGAFMTGVACDMVRQVHAGAHPTIHEALAGHKIRYGRMMMLWLVSWGLVTGVTEVAAAHASQGRWVTWAGLGGMIALQVLLVYAVPAAVFARATWWRAIAQSLQEAARHLVSTFVIVLLFTLPMIGFAYVAREPQVKMWMQRVGPEIVFVFIAARLAIWVISDAMLTVAISRLWLLQRVLPPAVNPGAPPAPGLGGATPKVIV